LLRPEELLQARDAYAAGTLDIPAFKTIEDRAVRDAITLQERAGCPVVTDGELRRESFQSELAASVDGIEGAGLDAWLWGEWHSDEKVIGDLTVERPADLAVVGRLRRRRSLAAEEFTFLRANTTQIPKVTLPSPSLFAGMWTPERSRGPYRGLDDFMADVTGILCDEARELERLGCAYIQLDAPHYPLLIDSRWQNIYERLGWSVKSWLSYGIDLDNQVIDAAPGVTFGFHLCRGNQGSRWLVTGGYDQIARPIFGRIHAHRLLLEYDDERSGSFDPLGLVPDDKLVVLGLVTTKTARLENEDQLVGRIEQAANQIDLERLAVGTQCGFSTSVIGNCLTIDDERRKLELIARTATRVWPDG
jgi:5-methyltetrahydropteroyltriglutamate--homocysteine methyltransferase